MHAFKIRVDYKETAPECLRCNSNKLSALLLANPKYCSTFLWMQARKKQPTCPISSSIKELLSPGKCVTFQHRTYLWNDHNQGDVLTSVCSTDAVTRDDFLFSTVKTDTLSNSSWNISSHPPSCPEASLQGNPPWQKLANRKTEADARAEIQLQSLELKALEPKLNLYSCPHNVSLQCYIIIASLF